MFDVGDLPVLTFGNWVLKAEWLSGLWNYMYVFCYVFFSKSKKHDFLRFFELLHTFSRTVVLAYMSVSLHANSAGDSEKAMATKLSEF